MILLEKQDVGLTVSTFQPAVAAHYTTVTCTHAHMHTWCQQDVKPSPTIHLTPVVTPVTLDTAQQSLEMPCSRKPGAY